MHHIIIFFLKSGGSAVEKHTGQSLRRIATVDSQTDKHSVYIYPPHIKKKTIHFPSCHKFPFKWHLQSLSTFFQKYLDLEDHLSK